MTVITGETGAGKTLLTEAIRLLIGGKAEPHLVRSGASEAWIEGRFLRLVDPESPDIPRPSAPALEGGDAEQVLARVVPTSGRSRAYLDGHMTPLPALVEVGERLVDLHGQNAHHSLLSPAAQRRALDSFGGVDVAVLKSARRRLNEIDSELAERGGDERMRERELDLLRFQVEELEAADLTDADEDQRLMAQEMLLADAGAHRDAAQAVYHALAGEGGANEALAVALKAASGREPLGGVEGRLRAVASELTDITAESSIAQDSLADDPERLATIQERRAALRQLQRKYGPSTAEVIAFRDATRARLSELERHDDVIARLDIERVEALATLSRVEAATAKARNAAAPELSREVEKRLHDLALPHARFEVQLDGEGAADDITFLLGPNRGMPLLPLAKAASGGELARTMLALRLALLSRASAGSSDPEVANTLIFDEVDAGIGGEAAVAVGQALASLAASGGMAAQVLVVTHLPQVAAFGDHQIVVEKKEDGSGAFAQARSLRHDEREVELARMLSGRPDSESGRAHARELLEQKAALPRINDNATPVSGSDGLANGPARSITDKKRAPKKSRTTTADDVRPPVSSRRR